MKIFSNTIVDPEGTSIFCLCIDTEITGNKEKDSLCCATENSLLEHNDPDKILNQLIPMLSELIYTAYGETPGTSGNKPISDIHATGFDPKYPNGVNTGIYDK